MTDGTRKNRQAEREVAELLEKWWRKVEPDCEFRRSIPTGGWPGKEGSQIRESYNPCGCLMTTAKRWPFTVSVRRRGSWLVDMLFDGKQSPVWGWWRTALEAASERNAIAMLWVRKDRSRLQQPEFPWFVLLPTTHWLVFYWMTERVLPKPDVEWKQGELWDSGIDFGSKPPALWFSERLLKINPKRLIGI